jgi:cobalamin biosynthesis Mg chelatase CobN
MASSSTKRRGNAGRDRTGGSSSSSTPSYRPQVHPILSEPQRDKPASKPSKAHRGEDVSIAEARKNAELEEKEKQEQLEALKVEAQEDQESGLFDNPVDDWVQQDLDLADPNTSVYEPSGGGSPQTSSSSRPSTTTTPSSSSRRSESQKPQTQDSPSSRDSSTSSDSDSETTEKKKFKDIVQDEKDSLTNRLQSERDSIKPEKVSRWNFRGRTKSRLKKAILGVIIAAIIAVPIGFIGVIPHAIQKWIGNRTSVYMERSP